MNIFFSIPTQDWLDTLVSATVLGGLVLAVEWVRWYTGWTVETTRRIAHVGTGILVFFAPLIIQSPLPAIVLGSAFTIVNFIAVRRLWFRAMHDTNRPTYGTVYYPLAFTILSALCWVNHKPVLMIGMGVLAVGDVVAASVGTSLRSPHRYNLGGDAKSVEGSAAMLVSSFLVILASFGYLSSIGYFEGSLTFVLVTATVASCLAVVAEGISTKGSDNLTIPLIVAFVIHLMLNGDSAFRDQFVVGFLLALAVAFLSLRLHFLDASGSAMALVLGTAIFGAGGWSWTVPILVFFITSSVWSGFGRRRKQEFDLVFEKGSTRDAGQVLANGGLAGCVVLGSVFWPSDTWMPVYLGVLAAVTSDTWATEIGIYFRHTPISILNLRKLQPGASGGITIPGTLGAVVGAVVIAATGWFVWPGKMTDSMMLTIVGAGVVASMFDSLLGATAQSQYLCPSCRRMTEKRVHCDVPASRVRGFGWMTNDAVNMFCALMGGLIMALLG